jgi:8-oxo-dGTP pyrophosphatase MutT (NUDIX family)
MKISKFKPKKGQTDFTEIRWAPVINCILKYRRKILLIQRSADMRLYPNYWNGISGFLDDSKGLKQKIEEELREEAGLSKRNIVSMKFGQIFDQEEPKYKKTWIVHPVLITVNTDKIQPDWEACAFRWIKPREAKKHRLLPGFVRVLRSLALVK